MAQLHGDEPRLSRSLNVSNDEQDEKLLLFVHDDVDGSTEVRWPAHGADSSVEQLYSEFFSCFGDIVNKRRARQTKDTLLDTHGSSDSQTASGGEAAHFSPDELKALYIEALYTVRHRIGQNKDPGALTDACLYTYLQQAFGISHEEHECLWAKACQEKSPVVVLEVTVVEARRLEAKDVNGFSDPYCMLGIVSNHEEENGGAANGKAGKKKPASAVDKIPARFIKTTSVKEKTLSPVWNEKFRFDLTDVATDVLHLDIWDHDDDSSVADSARRLNQVKGLKGLGRYFKQIAQSARSPSSLSNPATETLDDFLGTLDIPLADIPSTGLDVWMDLKGRSAKSKVEGQIHLKLTLATREERQLPDDERQFETKQHCDLMMIFIGHALKNSKDDAVIWSGDLPAAANTILHQHAVQGDITDAQQAICFWMAMCRKFCEQSFEWSFLMTCLDDLDHKWKPEDVYKEEEFAVADSFDMIIQYCLSSMSRWLVMSRLTMPIEKVHNMLTCLKKLYDSKMFKRCCVFKRELKSEIITTIKKSVAERYQRLQKARRSKTSVKGEDSEELVVGYIEMLDKLNTWLSTALTQYNQIFTSLVEVNFFGISFRETYKHLGADIQSDLAGLANLVSENPIDDSMSVEAEVQTVRPVLQLYCCFRDFLHHRQFLSSSDVNKLTVISYGGIFKPHIERWLAIVRHAVMHKVKASVLADKVEPLTVANLKQSSSSIDIAHTFGQVVTIWQCIKYPESGVAKQFLYDITKTLCESAVSYAELMHSKMKQAGYYDDEGQFDITPQLCIAINNIEQVRRALLALPAALKFSRLKNGGTDGHDTNSALCNTVHMADDKMTKQIKLVADHVADKMRADIKRFVFHLCWAPERALSEDAIGQLMNYLDSNLLTLNCNLLRVNFVRILDSIWIEVLEEFDEVLSRPDEELQEAKWMPNRLLESLQILVDFFHADKKGLQMSSLHCPLYNDLHDQLKLIIMPSAALIQNYFADKILQQHQTIDSHGGTLTVRVYYNSGAKLLTVEVLSARNLLPQDSNGLSDPYVVVELQPSHLFPGHKAQQTKVVRKTLNPTFNESFTFDSITEDQCSQNGACVLLSVMDQDMLSANDFAGEAFVSLRQATGVEKQKVGAVSHGGLLPITLSIVNYDAPPSSAVTKGRRGILSALSMKYDEQSTLQFAAKRRHLDYTVHRQSQS